MRDYAELVKKLRDCRNMAVYSEFWWDITTEAADAIDEMQAYADLYKELTEKGQTVARKLIDAYPKWISVEETPQYQVGDDGYTGYLVYANGYISVADYTVGKWDNVPSFHVDGEYEPDVEYFMPLPEPPVKEEK